MPAQEEIQTKYRDLHITISSAFYKKLEEGGLTPALDTLFDKVHSYIWDSLELALIDNGYEADHWMDVDTKLEMKGQYLKNRLVELGITEQDVAKLKERLGVI